MQCMPGFPVLSGKSSVQLQPAPTSPGTSLRGRAAGLLGHHFLDGGRARRGPPVALLQSYSGPSLPACCRGSSPRAELQPPLSSLSQLLGMPSLVRGSANMLSPFAKVQRGARPSCSIRCLGTYGASLLVQCPGQGLACSCHARTHTHCLIYIYFPIG